MRTRLGNLAVEVAMVHEHLEQGFEMMAQDDAGS